IRAHSHPIKLGRFEASPCTTTKHAKAHWPSSGPSLWTFNGRLCCEHRVTASNSNRHIRPQSGALVLQCAGKMMLPSSSSGLKQGQVDAVSLRMAATKPVHDRPRGVELLYGGVIIPMPKINETFRPPRVRLVVASVFE